MYSDGGARGNPGPAAIGVVIKDEEGRVIHRLGKRMGIATNNEAEYAAVIEALTFIANRKIISKRINFYLDSQLVASQLSGTFKTKNPKLKMFLVKVREKEAEVGGNIFYQYIPREQNREADELLNQALDKEHEE